ncbi:MAG: hypothetical protein FWG17_00665 [Desulfovibrionaceae bacterium]|nr:hypothetical protein [Desulfovibrionaceae bacterium]
MFAVSMAAPPLEGRVESQGNSLWERWSSAGLRIRRFRHGRDGFLAVWLEPWVEEEIAEIWNASPGDGFYCHTLASRLCWTALRTCAPGAEGCAPFPEFRPPLRRVLEEEGLLAAGERVLRRRYALLTFYPFRRGCAPCALRSECPQGQRTSI